MNFSGALSILRAGGVAKRKEWEDIGAYVVRSNDTRELLIHVADAQFLEWTAQSEDLLAEDWYELDKGTVHLPVSNNPDEDEQHDSEES